MLFKYFSFKTRFKKQALRQNPLVCSSKSVHTTPCFGNTLTPPEKDPSLEWTRSGKEFKNGPDQVIPSTAIYTWNPNGAVKFSQLGRGGSKNLPSISIPTMFRQTVERKPKHPAMCVKRDGKWQAWTYTEYYEQSRAVAKAFIALGLEPFHSVCILGFNSPEWFIADMGTIMAGGIPAGIYTTNSPEATAYIAKDSGANIIVVEDEQQLAKVLQHRNNLPDLKTIVQYIGKPTCEGVLSWDELVALGEQQSDDALNDRLRRMATNQCCTLIYTSGTTGNPKGVMISHDNVTWLTQEASKWGKFDRLDEQVVSFLPLSHVAAQIADIYLIMYAGGTTFFADASALRGTLVETMKEVKPTKFLAVPRVWEKMYEKMMEISRANTGIKLKIATWAKEQGTIYNEKRLQGEGNAETFQFKLANLLVLSNVRKALGLSNADATMSAAAPISMEIMEYFASLNIVISEAYGLSECSGPHCIGVEARGKVRFGSIGQALEGVDTRLDKPNEDGQGEICLGGRHILMGYLNNEEKTRNAVDNEGWLHTEDIGRIDEDGFVFVTGRIKELLITAGGENVAPVPIEDNVKQALPFLSNAMVLGDKLKFISVLITLKTEMHPETHEPLEKLQSMTKRWIEKHGDCKVDTVADVRMEVYTKKNKKLINAIQAGICLSNVKSVSKAQRIQSWYILPKDFSIPGGELGPTLKLKRNIVVDKYKDVIDKIYKECPDPNATGCLG